MSDFDDLARLAGVTFDLDRAYEFQHTATVTSSWLDPFQYPCTCDIAADHTSDADS